MNSTNLECLGELEMLLSRFSYLGIEADITSMSIFEAWCIYRLLLRLADG